MKKFLLVLALFSGLAFAEASFDQIESLIEQRNYQAAEQGLEVIIKNHPQSAKAFYAMAQAQAGLGNLEKAQKALNIATGLNPTLDFAPASSVASLKQAITPQVAKIQPVETSHFWRNFAYFALFCGFVVACYFLYSVYARKRDEDEGSGYAGTSTPPAPEPSSPTPSATTSSTYSNTRAAERYAAAYRSTPRSVTPVASAPAPAPTPSHTTVVNNNSGGNDMLTGVLIGNMLSSHHETTRVVEREVVREVPAPSRSSSWDDTPSTPSRSSRSSSWDDDSSSSSSKSSSWDDSSSKSSSSWSSSSDSSSSSSWDSGSSSSSSSDW